MDLLRSGSYWKISTSCPFRPTPALFQRRAVVLSFPPLSPDCAAGPRVAGAMKKDELFPHFKKSNWNPSGFCKLLRAHLSHKYINRVEIRIICLWKESSRTSAVIPVYNQCENLRYFEF